MKWLFRTCIILFIASCFSSCTVHRFVPDGEVALKKNRFDLIGEKEYRESLDLEELEGILKQKASRKKFLGLVYLHPWMYRRGEIRAEKGKGGDKWLELGEPLVLLDSTLSEKSSRQLQLQLKKKGFFFNSVEASHKVYGIRKKKAITTYNCTLGDAYHVRKISFAETDSNLMMNLVRGARDTKLRIGTIYNEDVFASERDRTTRVLKNAGFYDFRKEYVFFRMDSTVGNHQVDVEIILRDKSKTVYGPNDEDSLIYTPHEKYRVNRILVNANYSLKNPTISEDTIKSATRGIYFLNADQIKVNPKMLEKSIFIKTNSLYDKDLVDYTYKRLGALRVFKSISIRFEESSAGPNELDCYINMSMAKKQAMSLELEGTHRNRNLGIAGGVVYSNRNTLGSADNLELSVTGGLEDQQVTQASSANTIFNTRELGVELSYFVPSLLIPSMKKTPKYTNPKTRFDLGLRSQARPDYRMRALNLSFNYSWQASDYHSFQVFPIDLGLVWIEQEPFFKQQIEDTKDTELIYQYSDHLISSSKLNYTYSTQSARRKRNFTYFKSGIELSGNAIQSLFKITNQATDTAGNYRFFGIQFAQFIRLEADYRIYRSVSKEGDLVGRAYVGVGVPYGNFPALPFEKSFFAGGSNGLRAWTTRTIGPGDVSSAVLDIDQLGNLQLEANLEYRFKISKLYRGAFFVDAGNIFLLNKDDDRPGGEFNPKTFYQVLALGTGFGARIDLDFFIIRLDVGAKVHDPSRLLGERWFFEPKTQTDLLLASKGIDPGAPVLRNFHLNLGIGYPF